MSKYFHQIIDLPPLALAIIRGTQDQIEDVQQRIDDLLAQVSHAVLIFLFKSVYGKLFDRRAKGRVLLIYWKCLLWVFEVPFF